MLCDPQKLLDNASILRSTYNQEQLDKKHQKPPIHFLVQFSRFERSGNQQHRRAQSRCHDVGGWHSPE